MIRPPPRSTLFPNTSFFRSVELLGGDEPPQPHLGPGQAERHGRRAVEGGRAGEASLRVRVVLAFEGGVPVDGELRSEEHTSELQSHLNLVCRLLLEKKKISD